VGAIALANEGAPRHYAPANLVMAVCDKLRSGLVSDRKNCLNHRTWASQMR